MKKPSVAGFLFMIVGASGCAAGQGRQPILTARAFDHAAAKCHVEPLGLHYAKGSTVPYGDYLLPRAEVEADEDARQSPACMRGALQRYRYDFLGQLEHKPKS